MFIKQISVFLENTPGTLHATAKLLGEGGIDMKAMCIADTANFGILRLIIKQSDVERAIVLLRSNGYTARVSDVLCVRIPDRPCGLASAIECLDAANISIEYTYSFVRTSDMDASIVFKLNDPQGGAEAFLGSGVKLMNNDEVDAL